MRLTLETPSYAYRTVGARPKKCKLQQQISSARKRLPWLPIVGFAYSDVWGLHICSQPTHTAVRASPKQNRSERLVLPEESSAQFKPTSSSSQVIALNDTKLSPALVPPVIRLMTRDCGDNFHHDKAFTNYYSLYLCSSACQVT